MKFTGETRSVFARRRDAKTAAEKAEKKTIACPNGAKPSFTKKASKKVNSNNAKELKKKAAETFYNSIAADGVFNQKNPFEFGVKILFKITGLNDDALFKLQDSFGYASDSEFRKGMELSGEKTEQCDGSHGYLGVGYYPSSDEKNVDFEKIINDRFQNAINVYNELTEKADKKDVSVIIRPIFRTRVNFGKLPLARDQYTDMASFPFSVFVFTDEVLAIRQLSGKISYISELRGRNPRSCLQPIQNMNDVPINGSFKYHASVVIMYASATKETGEGEDSILHPTIDTVAFNFVALSNKKNHTFNKVVVANAFKKSEECESDIKYLIDSVYPTFVKTLPVEGMPGADTAIDAYKHFIYDYIKYTGDDPYEWNVDLEENPILKKRVKLYTTKLNKKKGLHEPQGPQVVGTDGEDSDDDEGLEDAIEADEVSVDEVLEEAADEEISAAEAVAEKTAE